MSSNENKSGRPKKEINPFNNIFRELIGAATQQEVADKIGVSRQNVGRWLLGDTTPDINTLGKIADAYNVSTDYLLGRTGIRNVEPDLIAAIKYTGLSDDTINALSSLIEHKAILSILIENIHFALVVSNIQHLTKLYSLRRYLNEKILPLCESTSDEDKQSLKALSSSLKKITQKYCCGIQTQPEEIRKSAFENDILTCINDVEQALDYRKFTLNRGILALVESVNSKYEYYADFEEYSSEILKEIRLDNNKIMPQFLEKIQSLIL